MTLVNTVIKKIHKISRVEMYNCFLIMRTTTLKLIYDNKSYIKGAP